MKLVSFDTETHLIRPGLLAPPLVCLTTYDGETPDIMLRDDAIEWAHENIGSVPLVGHNVAYDLGVLAAADGSLLPAIFQALADGLIFDTKIREMLSFIAQGRLQYDHVEKCMPRFGLSDCVRRHFGVHQEKEDTWRLRYAELDGVPLEDWPHEAIEYAVMDAQWTHQVAESQGPTVNEIEQVRAAWALHLMSCWGLRTDPERVPGFLEELREQQEALETKLLAAGLMKWTRKKGVDVLGRNMKAFKDRVSRAYDGDPPMTEKGAVKTDKDTCIQSGDPLLKEYADENGAAKILSTWGPYLEVGMTGTINHGYNILVDSGRTSAYKPNTQNPHRKGGLRECFIPRPGYVFVACDYSTIELRALAQVCLDKGFGDTMANSLRAGQDLHYLMASDILGVTYAEVLQHPEAKDARQMAKCFHPDTEILTPHGWRCIEDTREGDFVAAAIPDEQGGGITIEWQSVLQRTERTAETLVHLKNEGIDLRVTPDHRMLGIKYSTKTRRITGPKVVRPEELGNVRYWPNAGQSDHGSWEPDEQLLRIAVLTQADGSYTRGGHQIRFGFTKQRKIERFREILGDLPYRERVSSQGAQEFTFDRELADRVKALLSPEKTFTWCWLQLVPRLREAVLDEVKHWDGVQSPYWRMYSYSTTQRINVDVLQAIASISGRKTRITTEARRGKHSAVYNLSVKDHHLTRGGNLTPERIEHSGRVVCLSVPSSFVLVRDGGVPVVTGQCGNFGYPGGMGAASFVSYCRASWGVEIAETDGEVSDDTAPISATALKALWLKRWPEMKEYFAYIGNLSPMGNDFSIQQVRSNRVRGRVTYCAGCNTLFQGLAADGAKDALFEVARECYEGEDGALYGCRPVMFVHDEIVIECPEDRITEAAKRLSEVMVRCMERWIPDVPIEAEAHAMRRWYKDAEPVWVGGELVPWEPKE